MVISSTYYVPSILQPATHSLMGYFSIFDQEVGRNIINELPRGSSLICEGLHLIGMRQILIKITFVALMSIAAVGDLVLWTALTISIVGVKKVGFKNHLANLVAIVTTPFFLLPILFGYHRQLNNLRTNFFNAKRNLVTAIKAQDVARIKYLAPKVPNSEKSLQLAASLPNHSKSIETLIEIFTRPPFPEEPLEPRSEEVHPSLLVYVARIQCDENMQALIRNGFDPNSEMTISERAVKKVTLLSYVFFDLCRRDLHTFPFDDDGVRLRSLSTVVQEVEVISKLIEHGAEFYLDDLEKAMVFFSLEKAREGEPKLKSDLTVDEEEIRKNEVMMRVISDLAIAGEEIKLVILKSEGKRVNPFVNYCVAKLGKYNIEYRTLKYKIMRNTLRRLYPHRQAFVNASNKHFDTTRKKRIEDSLQNMIGAHTARCPDVIIKLIDEF